MTKYNNFFLLDFPVYEEDGNIAPRRLRFSKETYLSKPLPASAGVLASDPTYDLTDNISTLHLTNYSQKKGDTETCFSVSLVL